MAGVKLRHSVARRTEVETNKLDPVDEASSSSSGSPPPSSNSSSNDLKGLESFGSTSKGRSLRDRARIPYSFYVTVVSCLALQYYSGMWKLDTIRSWISSVTTSAVTVNALLHYSKDLALSLMNGDLRDRDEYIRAGIFYAIILSAFYTFVGKPLMAGVWTGSRAKRHVIHRYMGLAFMTQYFLAWVEFLNNYRSGAALSYMPHTIALNGIIQGYSAYFSFKILPEREDAGYFSDKAVMSRNFLHENIFFTLMCLFGSVYYHEAHREVLRSTLGGRIVEVAFIFFPYIVVRPFFPITRFKNAGTMKNSRTQRNEKFYQFTTSMVKIFYLWAKYFLGFFVNFMVFLDYVNEENWKFMHGMFLLNVGTVSLAMFLHTLRFRKILPPRFTFTVYLGQIYATFSALPLALNMFASHPKLCALALSGLLANMTRNRTVHGVWCVVSMLLLSLTEIEW